ncbi:helix-turn-helix domain-containing protein [Paenibacillus agricola]|uniref:Helix-turn-helix transcriptional regulator n=1 Tax=Paenibacillus agricola TaxID=2716264 RepID=A0ABX0J570_9BACL|nr:helix-turn-helix transcriptional regulator [Paenibacillus agricola]
MSGDAYDGQVHGILSSVQVFVNKYPLTQRESEILLMMAVHGFSNREIAEQCVISEKTVKNHLANIMNKMGIRSSRKLLSLLINHVHAYDHSLQSLPFVGRDLCYDQ